MGELNSDDHYIYYCGQESHRGNRVALIVNRWVWNAVLGCSLKNETMISIHFQGKPFSITVIQVYAPTTNAEEAEVEQYYEDLQDLLELTPNKRCPFHYRGLECKSRKSRNTWTYCIVVRKDDWNDFSFFEFTKTRFMAQDVIYSGEGSMCTWEKGEVDCFGVKCPIDIS